MNDSLGRLEDLPADYLQALRARNTLPLWPSLRAVLPYGRPSRSTQPAHWRYQDIRPQLLRAGELTPIEKAERRVLVLCNPGLGLETLRATPTIYLGLQLIQPRETAPTHRHTPSAIRFVIEGDGGYTVVGGEKLPMEPGDLILTPAGLWHEHGHEGSTPVIWLDALDLPLLLALEASCAVEGRPQRLSDPLNSSALRYAQGGLVPYATFSRPPQDYPLMRFPWKRVRQSLEAMAGVTARVDPVHLAYVNPETGRECLPTLGFSALMLRPGETWKPVRRSASGVLHAVEGAIEASVEGVALRLEASDTAAVPTHATVEIRNASGSRPAFLFLVDDAPLQRKLGFYEEFPAR